MSQLLITLDDDLLQDAQEYARQRGQSVEELIISLLQALVQPTTQAEQS